MSFEDSMFEEGFRDEQDYLGYLMDQADSEWKNQQDYDDEDEAELLYQQELHEEKVERNKERERVYNQFVNWQRNHPDEIDIWEGDSHNAEINNKHSPKLETWQKWKENREKEEKLIEEAKPQLAIIKNLINSDAISWGFNQFINDIKIERLIKIINEWKKENLTFIDEFNSFSVEYWKKYDYFQQKAIEEYEKIIVRHIQYPDSKRNKESFLGRIVQEDIQSFLDNRRLSILTGVKKKQEYKFNLDDIRKFELWVYSNHISDWNDWANSHHIGGWSTYIRNGYSSLYQSIWWKKGGELSYYEWKEKKTSPNFFHPLYGSEFKRRLILKKLDMLNYSGGNIFNDNLAVFGNYDMGYGYMDTNENIIIDVQFDDARSFHNGLAAVKVNAKEFYEYEPEIDNYFTFKWGGQWGFINTNGDFVIQPQYDILTPFKNGIAAYCKGAVLKEFMNRNNDCYYIPDGGKWGIITEKGVEIIPPTYDFIRFIGDGILTANTGGLRHWRTGLYVDGLWCVLSKDGNELTPFKYTYIFDYEDGKAIVNVGGVREECSDDNYFWNGKWGYIDEKGCEIEPLKEDVNIEVFKEEWEDTH